MERATEEEVDLYTQGFCHVFAVALQREIGGRLLVVTDPSEPTWIDPADGDNQVDGVVHVFVVIGDRAFDVEGDIPASDAEESCRERFGAMEPATDEVAGEAGLASYVEGQPGDDDLGIDRPLRRYSEGDVQRASEVARRVFPASFAYGDFTARARDLLSEHPTVSASFSRGRDPGTVVLDQVWSEQARGQGRASAFMRALLAIADEMGIDVEGDVSRLLYDLDAYPPDEVDALHALNEAALGDGELLAWYGRLGFENEGSGAGQPRILRRAGCPSQDAAPSL